MQTDSAGITMGKKRKNINEWHEKKITVLEYASEALTLKTILLQVEIIKPDLLSAPKVLFCS